ncbi:GNAT family N-acetyltransferase [Pseudomonas sp. IT-194MI4]|uniref:hypothetical protein n=1 Tax=Pseudomonas sp. IT-194MI4 TaxID=3026443 RepID=UPI0039E0B9A8
MKAPTLAEYFQRAGIEWYPAFAPFVQFKYTPLQSQVEGQGLYVHYQQYGLLDEIDTSKSSPLLGATLHYICMGNLNLLRIISKNRNETSSAGGKHAGLNLMQKVFALDDELAMAGKSMPGAV